MLYLSLVIETREHLETRKRQIITALSDVFHDRDLRFKLQADASSMRMPGQAKVSGSYKKIIIFSALIHTPSFKVHELREAVDVACGRLNFTTAFWSNMFVQHLTVKIVSKILYFCPFKTA